MQARVYHESLRLLKRVPALRARLEDEPDELEAFEWQVSRLVSLEPYLRDYLRSLVPGFCSRLAAGPNAETAEILQTIRDLRIDAGTPLMTLKGMTLSE